MKKLLIILSISLLSINLSSQTINSKVQKLKISMLPETSFRFPCGDTIGNGYYIANRLLYSHAWQGFHCGIDISGYPGGDSDLGDPIYSIGYGIVAYADSTEYIAIYYKYNGVIIKVVYYHCQEVFYKAGDIVEKSAVIATIGNSNGAYKAHLHLEMLSDTTIFFGGYSDNLKGILNPEYILPFYRQQSMK